MAAEPIRYYHRARAREEMEEIFGERWLRFAYEHPVGRLAVWLLARRVLFSRWYGYRMSRPASARLILPFITRYNLDVDEFATSPFRFEHFNAFFYRALRPGCRPITPGEGVAVLPADGRHLVFPDVDAADGFYVKGARFSLAELLDDADLAARFAGGAMVISRLCPVDYHRFHFPVAGVPGEPRRVQGWLYSVSPIALRRRIRYLVENQREITLVESPAFGPVAVLEVGATNVGSILQSFVPGRPVAKGDEKGLFAFGGSCVITLFARGRIRFDADLVAQSAQHVETYARMGESLGTSPAA